MIELYRSLVISIGDGTGQSDTLLHLHAGMAIFLLARLLSGRSLGSWFPITMVFLAAILKEIADRIVYGSWRWHDTPWDILSTIFWPSALWIGIKIRPLIEGKAKAPEEDPADTAPDVDQPGGR